VRKILPVATSHNVCRISRYVAARRKNLPIGAEAHRVVTLTLRGSCRARETCPIGKGSLSTLRCEQDGTSPCPDSLRPSSGHDVDLVLHALPFVVPGDSDP